PTLIDIATCFILHTPDQSVAIVNAFLSRSQQEQPLVARRIFCIGTCTPSLHGWSRWDLGACVCSPGARRRRSRRWRLGSRFYPAPNSRDIAHLALLPAVSLRVSPRSAIVSLCDGNR